MSKRSTLNLVLYGVLSLIPLVLGLYVLIEKKMIIGGRLAPGEIQILEFPANMIMAFSFFLFTPLILFALMGGKHKNKICEWIFFTALILFITAVFL